MGAAVAPAAAIVGIGANVAGGVMQGEGQQAADNYQAAVLTQKAQAGQVAATETNANSVLRLNQTLDNIDAVRAASHNDPSSPTGSMLRNTAYDYGNEERAIRVGNILTQSEQDLASADYEKKAGSFAMTQGILSGIAGAAGSIAKTKFS